MKSKKSHVDSKGRRSKSSSPELKAIVYPSILPGEVHYSSSAFQNSPDPSALPVPIFDDEPSSGRLPIPTTPAVAESTAMQLSKTEKLRQFLNLRPQAVAF